MSITLEMMGTKRLSELEDGEEDTEMLSSGYDVPGVIMNIKQLQPPTQDMNKQIKHNCTCTTNWEEENPQACEGNKTE